MTMMLMLYMMHLFLIHHIVESQYYYKETNGNYEVYYGPKNTWGYKEFKAPKSHKVNHAGRGERPGKCIKGEFQCGRPFSYAETKSFECEVDYQCPRYFKCCQNYCFQHKICQPIDMEEFNDIETETPTDKTETTSFISTASNPLEINSTDSSSFSNSTTKVSAKPLETKSLDKFPAPESPTTGVKGNATYPNITTLVPYSSQLTTPYTTSNTVFPTTVLESKELTANKTISQTTGLSTDPTPQEVAKPNTTSIIISNSSNVSTIELITQKSITPQEIFIKASTILITQEVTDDITKNEPITLSEQGTTKSNATTSIPSSEALNLTMEFLNTSTTYSALSTNYFPPTEIETNITANTSLTPKFLITALTMPTTKSPGTTKLKTRPTVNHTTFPIVTFKISKYPITTATLNYTSTLKPSTVQLYTGFPISSPKLSSNYTTVPPTTIEKQTSQIGDTSDDEDLTSSGDFELSSTNTESSSVSSSSNKSTTAYTSKQASISSSSSLSTLDMFTQTTQTISDEDLIFSGDSELSTTYSETPYNSSETSHTESTINLITNTYVSKSNISAFTTFKPISTEPNNTTDAITATTYKSPINTDFNISSSTIKPSNESTTLSAEKNISTAETSETTESMSTSYSILVNTTSKLDTGGSADASAYEDTTKNLTLSTYVYIPYTTESLIEVDTTTTTDPTFNSTVKSDSSIKLFTTKSPNATYNRMSSTMSDILTDDEDLVFSGDGDGKSTAVFETTSTGTSFKSSPILRNTTIPYTTDSFIEEETKSTSNDTIKSDSSTKSSTHKSLDAEYRVSSTISDILTDDEDLIFSGDGDGRSTAVFETTSTGTSFKSPPILSNTTIPYTTESFIEEETKSTSNDTIKSDSSIKSSTNKPLNATYRVSSTISDIPTDNEDLDFNVDEDGRSTSVFETTTTGTSFKSSPILRNTTIPHTTESFIEETKKSTSNDTIESNSSIKSSTTKSPDGINRISSTISDIPTDDEDLIFSGDGEELLNKSTTLISDAENTTYISTKITQTTDNDFLFTKETELKQNVSTSSMNITAGTTQTFEERESQGNNTSTSLFSTTFMTSASDNETTTYGNPSDEDTTKQYNYTSKFPTVTSKNTNKEYQTSAATSDNKFVSTPRTTNVTNTETTKVNKTISPSRAEKDGRISFVNNLLENLRKLPTAYEEVSKSGNHFFDNFLGFLDKITNIFGKLNDTVISSSRSEKTANNKCQENPNDSKPSTVSTNCVTKISPEYSNEKEAMDSSTEKFAALMQTVEVEN